MKCRTAKILLGLLLSVILIISQGCKKNILKTNSLSQIEEVSLESILVKNSWYIEEFFTELPDTLILTDSISKIANDWTHQAKFFSNGDLHIWVEFKLELLPDPQYSKWNQVDNKIRFTFPTEVVKGSVKYEDIWYTYYIDNYSKEQVVLVDSLVYHSR